MKRRSLIPILVVLLCILFCITAFADRKCAHGRCDHEAMKGSSYCRYHTCKEPGCNAEVSGANERCPKHKEAYYKEQGITTSTCNVPGCNNHKCTKLRRGSYCYSHTCSAKECTNMKMTGGSYCFFHTCRQSGCYNYVSGGGYCSSHK